MNQLAIEKLEAVNTEGFAAIDVSHLLSAIEGSQIYQAMDTGFSAPDRGHYFNEISFNWGETESDAAMGFHDQKTIATIHSVQEAQSLLRQFLSESTTFEFMSFLLWVKESCLRLDLDLVLARCMIRQYGPSEEAQPRFSSWHEDQGWVGKEYEQHLTAAITLHGIPTEAQRHKVKVGELLVFNAKDRRLKLGLGDSKRFLHRGPSHGPKLFVFWEFLKKKMTENNDG